MKLRNMSASVETAEIISIELPTGEIIKLENARILKSYSSIVAVFCSGTVYLLPRYDYSKTTWSHVHAFVQDCTNVCDMCAGAIRKAAAGTDSDYQFASRYNLDSYDWLEY